MADNYKTTAQESANGAKKNRSRKKKRGKKRFKAFSKFLLAYAGILAALIVIVWIMLVGFMRDYEEGRPNVAMDKIISQFEPDNIEKLLDENGISLNEFENNAVIAAYLKEKLGGSEISYKKKAGEFSEETPVYIVYAGDAAIAKVSLAENGKNAHKFKKWKLGTVSFDGCMDNEQKKEMVFTVPSGSTIQLNGVEVGESYITEEAVQFEPCMHVGDYVDTPVKTVYTVSGLIMEPDVKVIYNGEELAAEEQDGSYTAEYPSDEELLAQQQDHIMSIAEDYGRYIINRGSLSKLNANMIGNAREYVSDIPAIWAFLWGMTYTYEFQNESISNFRKYSDDCFSCDIYYDLYVKWNNGSKTYNTSLTYTFVKVDGKWYVADMIIN